MLVLSVMSECYTGVWCVCARAEISAIGSRIKILIPCSVVKNIDISINIDTEISERVPILISRDIDTTILAQLSFHFSPKVR